MSSRPSRRPMHLRSFRRPTTSCRPVPRLPCGGWTKRDRGGAMDRKPPRAERRRLTHVDRSGRPRMVDVSAKPSTARRAVAEAAVAVSQETLSLVIDGGGPKGDVLGVAEIAGVMAAKRTCGADPAVPSAAAHRPGRGHHAGPCRGSAADPRRGRDHRSDRRRDGGTDRGFGRGPDRVRHGQGRREGRRDPLGPPRLEERRQERRLDAARGRRCASSPRAPRRRPGDRVAGRVGSKRKRPS